MVCVYAFFFPIKKTFIPKSFPIDPFVWIQLLSKVMCREAAKITVEYKLSMEPLGILHHELIKRSETQPDCLSFIDFSPKWHLIALSHTFLARGIVECSKCYSFDDEDSGTFAYILNYEHLCSCNSLSKKIRMDFKFDRACKRRNSFISLLDRVNGMNKINENQQRNIYLVRRKLEQIIRDSGYICHLLDPDINDTDCQRKRNDLHTVSYFVHVLEKEILDLFKKIDLN